MDVRHFCIGFGIDAFGRQYGRHDGICINCDVSPSWGRHRSIVPCPSANVRSGFWDYIDVHSILPAHLKSHDSGRRE